MSSSNGVAGRAAHFPTPPATPHVGDHRPHLAGGGCGGAAGGGCGRSGSGDTPDESSMRHRLPSETDSEDEYSEPSEVRGGWGGG